MTTSKVQGLIKAQQKAKEVSADQVIKSRKSRETADSPLMSPVALMALGLAGAATAAVSKEFLSTESAVVPNASQTGSTTSPDTLAVTELVVDSVSPIATQMNALIQKLLTEKASYGFHQGDVVVSGDTVPQGEVAPVNEAVGMAPGAMAIEELPVLLAQASTSAPPGVVSESAAIGATGSGGATTTAGAASTVSSTALLIGAGLLGLAAIGGSTSSTNGAANPQPPSDLWMHLNCRR
jgi:hypothetical protein